MINADTLHAHLSSDTLHAHLTTGTITGKLYVGASTPSVEGNLQFGTGLKLIGNVLSVDTATNVEQDNTRPVTSAAVFNEIGNINALLETI